MFVLWLGWYGFNGAAATSLEQLASIFLTTTIAPAVATMVCMIFTWVKYGKPDVSMCLNASLAGLVTITAPCDVTDAFGAIVIGAVSGVLVVFGVWLLDYVLHVDDPVGAVAVHMMNGIWGTLSVGLFATTSAPGNDELVGLFYGGGFSLLGLQLLGFAAVAARTVVTITITFLVIRAAVGLRAEREEEITGLDITEHGLSSAYAGFSIIDANAHDVMAGAELPSSAPVSIPVPAASAPAPRALDTPKLTKVAMVFSQERLEALKSAMNQIGVTGMTVTQVLGYGVQKGHDTYYRGVKLDSVKLLPKVKVESGGQQGARAGGHQRSPQGPLHRSCGRRQVLRLRRGASGQGPHRRAGL